MRAFNAIRLCGSCSSRVSRRRRLQRQTLFPSLQRKRCTSTTLRSSTELACRTAPLRSCGRMKLTRKRRASRCGPLTTLRRQLNSLSAARFLALSLPPSSALPAPPPLVFCIRSASEERCYLLSYLCRITHSCPLASQLASSISTGWRRLRLPDKKS